MAIEAARAGSNEVELDKDEKDEIVQLYIFRAYSYLITEQYTAAARDVKLARRVNPTDLRLMSLQQRIQMAVKQAADKDYYKILGVPRCDGLDPGWLCTFGSPSRVQERQ